MPAEIVTCLQMGTNAYYYLAPIAQHPSVSCLHIVRADPIKRQPIPNSTYIPVSTWKPLRFTQMLWHALRFGRRHEVAGFVSINPFPYGLIQLIAALVHRKPIHYGFVGSDWYRHIHSRYGKWLRPLLRRADFVTATGEKMRQEMIAYGLEPERIAVLPHSIDLENYAVASPETATYDCIFVGQLIRRKRIDLILLALAQVRRSLPEASLCIVGDGPLREELEQLASQLGLADAVDFVGFIRDVQTYLAQARINLIASDMEGMPFAVIEGVACGLVPVCTPVGTIEDWIVDGENGLLFPTGDASALADHISQLLTEPALYQRLRRNVLDMRQQFSFEHATSVWSPWLEQITRQ